MSDHCWHRDWTIHDPVTDELLNDIAGCAAMNMRLAAKGCLSVFACFGHADSINYWCWSNFTHEKNHDKRVEMIEEEAKSAPDPEKFKQICMYVLERIESEEKQE